MTDLYVSIGTIKRIIKKGLKNTAVFESKNHVIVADGALVLIARKRPKDRGKRLFPSAYPFEKAGYTSISSWEKEGYPPLTVEEAVEDIRAILEQLSDDERRQVLRELEEAD